VCIAGVHRLPHGDCAPFADDAWLDARPWVELGDELHPLIERWCFLGGWCTHDTTVVVPERNSVLSLCDRELAGRARVVARPDVERSRWRWLASVDRLHGAVVAEHARVKRNAHIDSRRSLYVPDERDDGLGDDRLTVEDVDGVLLDVNVAMLRYLGDEALGMREGAHGCSERFAVFGERLERTTRHVGIPLSAQPARACSFASNAASSPARSASTP
jgi:hypothetical protein